MSRAADHGPPHRPPGEDATKPAPARATTDTKPLSNHEDHHLRLEHEECQDYVWLGASTS
jgi:hypothetical protein